jgi:hypothetical protein
MALTSGQIIINIGAPNNPTGSDSLYTAFGKIQDNFTNVFTEATAFSSANIATSTGLSNTVVGGVVTLTNTGVTNVAVGTNIVTTAGNGNIIVSLANVVTGLTSVSANNFVATANVNASNVTAVSVNTTNATATGNISANNFIAVSSTSVGTVMRLTPTSTAPLSPTQGTIYYDSFLNMLRVYNGTSWGNVALA